MCCDNFISSYTVFYNNHYILKYVKTLKQKRRFSHQFSLGRLWNKSKEGLSEKCKIRFFLSLIFFLFIFNLLI